MQITRKGFIKIALTFVGTAAFGESVGCGDSGGAGGSGGAASTTTGSGTSTKASSSTGGMPGCGASGTQIVGNHGHVLTVPMADLDATADKTYSIMGMATHDHMVTFTPAQLAMLKAGATVSVTSTAAVHTHVVNAVCV